MKALWIAFKDHEEEVNNKFNPAKYVSEDGDAVRVMIYLRCKKQQPVRAAISSVTLV